MILFDNPDETNDPEKVNKAFNDAMNESRVYADQKVGLIPRTSETITAGSDIGDRLLVESNDTNKRIVLNIDGVNYKVDLTPVD